MSAILIIIYIGISIILVDTMDKITISRKLSTKIIAIVALLSIMLTWEIYDFNIWLQIIVVYAVIFGYTIIDDFNNIGNRCFYSLLIVCIMYITYILSYKLAIITGRRAKLIDMSIIWIGFLALINVAITIYKRYIKISSKREYREQYEALYKEQQYLKQYVLDADVAQNQLRSIRHDIKNNLNIIANLINDGHYEEALQYIEEYENVDLSRKTYVYTNDAALNALLHSKYKICDDNNIKLTCIVDKYISGYKTIDLCKIVYNLLDNAIEYECTLSEERYIYISIKQQDEYIYVCVKNRIKESVLNNNPKLISTKNDKINHGQGSKIVSNIIKRRDGTCEYSEDNNYFICVCIF